MFIYFKVSVDVNIFFLHHSKFSLNRDNRIALNSLRQKTWLAVRDKPI